VTEGPALRTALTRDRLDEWALVLAAEGIDARVRPTGRGFALEVAPADFESAHVLLEAYERENVPVRGVAPAPLWSGDVRVGLIVPLALLGFFVVTGPLRPGSVWFAAGSADAARILGGELWRTVTALTLHADLAHVTANVVAGTVFLVAACRVLGPGVACAGVLLAGAGGNLVNAWVHGSGHVSVGASTAVFGAVGLLAGAASVRRYRVGIRGRRSWAPVAAGLGVLAMLGAGGEGVDIWAHLFGLAVGASIGFAVARVLPAPPGARVQWLLGVASLAVVVGCWALARAALGPR
jgi:rhomboid protease GluP